MDEQNIATNVEVDNSQLNTTPTTDTSNTATNIEVDNSQINVPVETPQEQITNAANEGDFNETPPSQPQVPAVEKPEGLPDLSQQVAQMEVDQSYEENLQYNNGRALQNFLENEYDYDKNEAGTYWVAGAINDVDTQMKFLNTLINEEMYDEMELTKFYYDNTMATARAYAAQKKKEVAYGFYRAAQEKAIAEASLTGWYMPAEGEYMLGQYTIAQNTLDRTDATPEEKARAQRVINVTEKWFNANNIGTRGMKCLSLLQYEETVRHNKAAEALQHQANQIAAAGNAISAAGNNLQLREWKFSLEEMELQTGHDWTGELGLDNDNIIGHNQERDYKRFQNLRGYGEKTITREKQGTRKLLTDGDGDPTKQITLLGPDEKAPKDWLEYNRKKYREQGLELVQGEDGKWYTYEQETVKTSGLANLLTQDPYYYSAIIGAIGSEGVNETLKENGLDPKIYYAKYQSYLGDQALKENHDKNGNILDESYLNKQTYKVAEGDGKGKNVYTFNSSDEHGNAVTRCYYKDDQGVFHQIENSNLKLSGDKTINDMVVGFTKKQLEYDGEGVNVGNKFNRSEMAGSYTANIDRYDRLSKKQKNTIKEKEKEGYRVLDGYASTKKVNTAIVMGMEIDGTMHYYEVENDGKFQEVSDKESIVQVTIKAKPGEQFLDYDSARNGQNYKDGSKVSEVDLKGNGHVGDVFRGAHGHFITDKSFNLGNDIYMYVNPDGTQVYYTKEGGTIVDGKMEHWYTVVSEKDAIERSGFDADKLSKMSGDRTDYHTGYIKTEAGKNSDTREREQYENTQKELAESTASSGGSGGSGGGSSPRNVSTKNGDAEDTDVYHIEKTLVDMEGAPDLLSKETPYVLNDKKQTVNDVTNNDKEKKKTVKKETKTTGNKNKNKKASA